MEGRHDGGRQDTLVSMSLTVRPRHDGDLDGLAEELRLVAKADGYPSRWPGDPVAWVRGRDVPQAWVASAGDVVVGQVLLRRPGDDPPARMHADASLADVNACAVVERMFVTPVARGRGLGEALLLAAWQEASSRNLHAVLDVVSTNLAAVRLYRRLGWRYLGDYEYVFGDGGPDELLHCFAAPAPTAN